MPLIDLGATTTVEINEDWYELRNELGFYAETIMLVDAVDPDELRSFKLVDESNGIVKSKQTPGEMVARRNFVKLQAYLIKWSHSDSLTFENIKRIPRDDAKKLLEKITELEDSTSEPFRNENEWEESKTGTDRGEEGTTE